MGREVGRRSRRNLMGRWGRFSCLETIWAYRESSVGRTFLGKVLMHNTLMSGGISCSSSI
jgi:hypothetical protein